MFTVLSALLGFVGPFIPELIKFFKQKQDNQHGLAILALQAEAAKQEHLYKLEELNTSADIAESANLRLPQQSFGVQVLDAAKDWPKGVIVPVFYLFSFLDFMSGFVRPAVTYAFVGFYLMYKWALFEVAKLESSSWIVALPTIWSEADFALLTLTLSFWFGSRAAKAAFGGSASTGRSGGG